MNMNMNQTTVTVATMFLCDMLMRNKRTCINLDSLRRQTVVGCHVLQLLQNMYRFKISFVHGDILWNHLYPQDHSLMLTMHLVNNSEILHRNGSAGVRVPDLFIRPSLLLTDLLDVGFPLAALLDRRYGFTLLRRKHAKPDASFYGPFAYSVWQCLIVMVMLVSMVFYLLHRWEKRLFPVQGECSFYLELLVAIGAYCQHSVPVQPILTSRRLAYLTFFAFSYVIFSHYTSNLLSHLVSDMDQSLSLEELIYSNYRIVILDSLRINVSSRFPVPKSGSLRRLLAKVSVAQKVNVTSALSAVKQGSTAVLSDFISLYPFISAYFDSNSVCHLEEINVMHHFQEYMFASRGFAFKEQLKIGILRVKESGILKRLLSDRKYSQPKCSYVHDTEADLIHVTVPLIVLATSYVLAAMVMIAERIHFYRNLVYWPYVD